MRLSEAIDERYLAFWKLVKKGPGCWIWQGTKLMKKDGRNYGRFRFKGKRYLAHRLAWELSHGVKPGRAKIRHSCDNPPCCRPLHLLRGTQKQNVRDSIKRGRFGVRGNKPGSAHPMARLTQEQVNEIRRAPKVRGFQRDFALRFGVSQAQVSLVRRGLSWFETSVRGQKVDNDET